VLKYSTRAFESWKQKRAYWHDVVAESFTVLDVAPVSTSQFDADIAVIPLGGYGLGNAVSEPASINRTKHIRPHEGHRYFLHLQLEGKLHAFQDGHSAVLEEGDMVLCDNAAPYSLSFRERASTLIFSIPPKELYSRLPAAEMFLGVRLCGSAGLPSIVSAMLKSLWARAQGGERWGADIGHRIAGNVVDVLATSCAEIQNTQVHESAVGNARRLGIVRHIENNLKDPDLSPASIARAQSLSPRYMRLLFAKQNETVSQYILRRRLEECAKRLCDIGWRSQTVTEIAFACGFNNASHFARTFRQQFGMSAREYRLARAA
jgi:AraC-like DNA-binding protein